MGWIGIAVVCAGLFLWAFYREDRHEHEPIWMVALALGWGALAIVPALWLEGRLLPAGLSGEDPLKMRVLGLLLVVGPVEEFCKFAGVRFYIWRHSQFNEPMDGIIYAAAAATGFALVENFYFMVDQPAAILGRGPAGTLAHILFAGFWGSALGWARFCSPWRGRGLIALGLLWGSLSHGLFDLLSLSANYDLPGWAARLGLALLMVGSYLVLRRQMLRASAESPFQKEKAT
jgi:RsiW-degrading membrane proteinase PrsW (M82 family)